MHLPLRRALVVTGVITAIVGGGRALQVAASQTVPTPGAASEAQIRSALNAQAQTSAHLLVAWQKEGTDARLLASESTRLSGDITVAQVTLTRLKSAKVTTASSSTTVTQTQTQTQTQSQTPTVQTVTGSSGSTGGGDDGSGDD